MGSSRVGQAAQIRDGRDGEEDRGALREEQKGDDRDQIRLQAAEPREALFLGHYSSLSPRSNPTLVARCAGPARPATMLHAVRLFGSASRRARRMASGGRSLAAFPRDRRLAEGPVPRRYRRARRYPEVGAAERSDGRSEEPRLNY